MGEGTLRNRVVAVTGASSGIGAATALACAEAGAAVALAGRRADRLEALAARISASGGRALPVAADVGQEADARAFVAAAHRELGRLDALVNNAGVMLLGSVLGARTADWRRMVDVNVYGALYCTHAALPLMVEAGRGHVVNVSSVGGRFAGPGSAVYNLTKWGLNGFSEALRQEVLEHGVRVTVVEPGAVVTELLDHNEPEIREPSERYLERIEPLRAADVADAIVYALTRPPHVAVNEILVRPTAQRG